MKEAYATEFAATIERAEKQIILARHGRRLLNLIDDTPVIPGDMRAPYEHAAQARQILNDAEDDLRDWTPELEDVPSSARLENNLMPAESSVGDDTMVHHDESRISSGTSVTTGQAGYAPSDAGTAGTSQVAA